MVSKKMIISIVITQPQKLVKSLNNSKKGRKETFVNLNIILSIMIKELYFPKSS